MAPAAGVPAGVLEAMARSLEDTFGLPVILGKPFAEPASAHDPDRNQWSAPGILMYFLDQLPADTFRLLAVTGRDLYSPLLSFVFGQAQLGGPLALVSLARLRQEFHGLPADEGLLVERARKEAVHEMGHTYGLVHCPNPVCVMSLATGILHIDRKSDELCPSCVKLLGGRSDGPHSEESR